MKSPFQALAEAAAAEWDVPALAAGVSVDGRHEVATVGCSAEDTFRVASITKPFTATLALELLDLDATVGVWPEVSVRQLLSHTSGYDGELGDLHRFGAGDDALERLALELPTVRRWCEPGYAWSYSNAGYWLAGLLCARAAGATYEAALEGALLAPLGLRSTSFDEPALPGWEVDLATGRRTARAEGGYPRARRPSGGLVSSVADLLRFGEWQLAERRTRVLREPVAPTPGGSYGLGFDCEPVDGVAVWGHGGSYGGYQSSFALLPERGLVFVGLAASGIGGQALRQVEDAAFERFADLRRRPPETVPPPPGELELLAGDYRQPEFEVTFRPGEEMLLVDAVDIGLWSDERTVLPTLHARPLGNRTYELVDGVARGSRFDFLPAAGAPRFARVFSRLAERVT